jgi:hypothetical protein
VYVLHDGDRQYYVGETFDIAKRIEAHRTCQGAAITRRWLEEGNMPELYWIIQIGIPISKPELRKFESLVRKRLQIHNPDCAIY